MFQKSQRKGRCTMSRLWQEEREPEDGDEGSVVHGRPPERDRSNDIEYRRWGFRRSAKGNLYRKAKDGSNCTVFPDRYHEGRWAYCIARGAGDVSYSAERFECEADAVFALMNEPGFMGEVGG
jgi:hypothetical protein